MKGFLQLKFDVLGKPWTLRVLTDKYYKKKNGSDSAAITKVHKRRIELRPKFLDLETVVHELLHAYLYEMCLHSTNEITLNDQEEIFAELLAKRGREFLDLADHLHSQVHAAFPKSG